MYVCIYVCMYVCMYVYIYTHTQTYIVMLNIYYSSVVNLAPNDKCRRRRAGDDVC
jgi:hypothetical protein